MVSARVLIIAVNYFGSATVARLVDSVRAQSLEGWRLLIVDNSNDERECARLLEIANADDRIETHAALENLGYFGGARYGLSCAQDSRADWTVVCNVDLEFDHRALSALTVHDPASSIGVVGPSITSARSGKNQNPLMSDRPSPRYMRRRRAMFAFVPVARVMVGCLNAIGKLPSRATRDGRARVVYAVHGSWMAFSSEFFRRGGTFEHPPFLFAEEITVAERCRQLHLDAVFDPDIRIVHDEHQSTGVWRSRFMLERHRESVKYAEELLRIPARR